MHPICLTRTNILMIVERERDLEVRRGLAARECLTVNLGTMPSPLPEGLNHSWVAVYRVKPLLGLVRPLAMGPVLDDPVQCVGGPFERIHPCPQPIWSVHYII